MASSETAPYIFATAGIAAEAKDALDTEMGSTQDFLITDLDEVSFKVSWTMADPEVEQESDRLEYVLRPFLIRTA